MPIATLIRVGVRSGETPILRGLDFTLDAGQAIGLMGANGSGKTTLLRVLATLRQPSTGDGEVLGADLRTDGRYEVRHQIALVGHTSALWDELTLEENLLFAARLTGHTTREVAEVLDAVGLTGARHRRAAHSSHGMRRRVEFARILMTRPTLLLLDEAHAGLDAAAVSLVDHLVADVTRRGGGAVIVSHEYDRMAATVDHVVEIVDGAVRRRDDA